MRCIPEDVREYRTKWMGLKLGSQIYHCKVGVVPRPDCAVLVGRDCPMLATLLQKPQAIKPLTDGRQTKVKWDYLPLGPGELAHLTMVDPMLKHALAKAARKPDAGETGPVFKVC